MTVIEPPSSDVAASVLRIALHPLKDQIQFAILFGSVAKGCAHSGSDVDVLIVSDELWFYQAFDALDSVWLTFSMPASPILYTTEEFLERRKNANSFLTRVLEGPHRVLLGSEPTLLPEQTIQGVRDDSCELDP